MTLERLRANFKGVRANRFKVTGQIPGSAIGTVDQDFEFYCKAAQFPGSNISVVGLNYRGRIIKYPAERTFQDWGIQIYSSRDSSADLRKKFQKWIDTLNSSQHDVETWNLHRDFTIYYNELSAPTPSPNQSSITPDYGNSATLKNAFPIDISPIEFSEDVADSFVEFTVTLTFDRVLYST